MRRFIYLSLVAFLSVVCVRPALAQFAISVSFGPPPLPIYEQPMCPEEGFIWVPGYWAWDADDDDYYWVPGTWVMAPEPGMLWTPPWWGWENGAYLFHDGYWAPEVGFYGGIYYGFGYPGHGFYGGRWDNGRFMYNRVVTNVNVTVIHNVYEDRSVVRSLNETRVSYNGGQGGIDAQPTPQERHVGQLRHFPPARPQVQRREMARSNPQMRASANLGKPPVAATQRPTDFKGNGVVAARAAGGSWHPPANRGRQGGANARAGERNNGAPVHARDLQQHQMLANDNQMSPKEQKQEQKLIEKQNKEHHKLEQKQQKEDEKAQQQHWNQQKQQQLEQRHQQQTQQMQQRHEQQQQRIRQRQAKPEKPQ